MTQITIHNPDDLETIDYRELKPLQGDLKDLSEKNFVKLKKVLEKRGFTTPVFVWRDGETQWLMDGHQRQRVMIKADMSDNGNYNVPRVSIVAKNIKDAKAQLLEITSQYGTITQEGFDQFVAEADLPEAEVLDSVSFDALQFGDTEADDDDDESEDDEAPAVDDSVPPLSQKGKIYQLGDHRLMCGDATSSDDVSALIAGEKIDMLFTDPPYGINVKGDRQKNGKKAITKGNKLKDFVDDSIEYAIKAIKIVADLDIKKQVWFGANYYAHHLPQTNNWLVWDKRVEEKHEVQQSSCELAWVKTTASSVRIFRHLWKGLIKDSEHGQRRVHPTQKPVALAEWCFNQYDADGKTVLDLFGGSGSTLIAAENADRVCYMMEIDEQYCDVIRKRYWMALNDGDDEGWAEGTPEAEA